MSVTITTLTTEVGSIIYPTNPLVLNSLFGILLFFQCWVLLLLLLLLFVVVVVVEAVTSHEFEEPVTEQNKLIMGDESI